MSRFDPYVGRFNTARTRLTTVPQWGVWILFVAALPGLLMLALSLCAALVSILALLLLTVPAYRLVRWLMPKSPPDIDPGDPGSSERKQVTVTVLESESSPSA